MADLLERMRVLADDLLFEAALEVDRSGKVPAGHWERLAAEGMYGLAAPAEHGGPGLEFPEIVEAGRSSSPTSCSAPGSTGPSRSD